VPQRRPRSPPSTREGDEETVALRIDLDSAMPADHLSEEEPVKLGENGCIALGVSG
jgi:hypothetical protein